MVTMTSSRRGLGTKVEQDEESAARAKNGLQSNQRMGRELRLAGFSSRRRSGGKERAEERPGVAP